MSTVRRLVVIVAGLCVVMVAVGVTIFVSAPRPVGASAYSPPQVGESQLQAVAGGRVFFAHQSVGQNVLSGVARVYAEHGLEPPPISPTATEKGPGIDDVLIGTNGDPLGKIRAFDAALRGGVGNRVDVALLKLCYVDVVARADVEAVFSAYRDTLVALQRDFPKVAVVAVTVPLTTQRDLGRRVKSVLGRDRGMGPEDNLAREAFNERVRASFGPSGRLFDIAAVESAGPDRSRPSYSLDGRTYFALSSAFAADPGHLNAAGGDAAGAAFLATVAAQLGARA